MRRACKANLKWEQCCLYINRPRSHRCPLASPQPRERRSRLQPRRPLRAPSAARRATGRRQRRCPMPRPTAVTAVTAAPVVGHATNFPAPATVAAATPAARLGVARLVGVGRPAGG